MIEKKHIKPTWGYKFRKFWRENQWYIIGLIGVTGLGLGFWGFYRALGHGKTIFYCSHVLDVVERLCHRLVIINEGRIIADGTFEELKKQSRGGTLEHIFTRLTSDGAEDSVAGAFVEALGEE